MIPFPCDRKGEGTGLLGLVHDGDLALAPGLRKFRPGQAVPGGRETGPNDACQQPS